MASWITRKYDFGNNIARWHATKKMFYIEWLHTSELELFTYIFAEAINVRLLDVIF